MNIFEAMKLVQKKAFVNDFVNFILKKFKKETLSTSTLYLSTTQDLFRETTGEYQIANLLILSYNLWYIYYILFSIKISIN